jgi:hypothetical protein
MLEWIGGLDEKELAIGVMVLYQLWLARNDAREETRILDPLQIAQRSIYLVEEWRESREYHKPVAPPTVEHWLPPEEGCIRSMQTGLTLRNRILEGVVWFLGITMASSLLERAIF